MALEKLIPELELVEDPIHTVVNGLCDSSIIVCDGWTYHNLFNHYPNVELVVDNDAKRVQEIKDKRNYARVLAVGGCTALDMGRACAVGKEVIAIPTILSTACISVDLSVIRYPEGTRLERTVAPTKIIVSIPSIKNTSHYDLELWSQSGFGDIFARISAAIEKEMRDIQWSYHSAHPSGILEDWAIRRDVPNAIDALEWVLHSFTGYTEDCLRRLATYSHNESVRVIIRGNTNLSAGGEHTLYHHLVEQHDEYTPSRPTHGQIVAMGTLLVARIFAEKTGDYKMYEQLRAAYTKLGLPTNYDELRKIGIEKEHIVKGLHAMSDSSKSRTWLGDYFEYHSLVTELPFKEPDYSLVDRCFTVNDIPKN